MKLFDDTSYVDNSVMAQETRRHFHAAGKELYGSENWENERHKLLERRFGFASSKQLSNERGLLLIAEFKKRITELEVMGLADSINITDAHNQERVMKMTFDAGLVNGIDQSTVDNEGPAYPVIQWVNGSPANKPLADISYTGGWFMSEANCELQGAEGSFEAWSMMHRDGTQTEGFGAEGLHFAVLHTRNRWEVYEEGGQRKVFAWSGYEAAQQYGRPSGRLHMLVVVKGLEAYGPHIVTLRGMTGAAITKRNGIIHQFADRVLKAANIASSTQAKGNGNAAKRWPRRMFWMPFSSQRTPGSWEVPVFSTVGKGQNTSQITYPALVGVPDDVEKIDLNKFFVGKDLMETINDLYADTAAWSHEWDSLEAGITAAEADGYADQQQGATQPPGTHPEEQFGGGGDTEIQPPPMDNEEIPF